MTEAFDTERRRLRRRLWFWRIAALVAAIAGGYAALRGDGGPAGPYLARYAVEGVIFDDPLRDAMLAEIAGDDDAMALILRINSPGGSTAGSEALFESLRGVAARKPVVAVMGEAAASGGYIAAIAADHIVARGNSITGSIGVIVQYPEIGGLLDRVGVVMREVKSSPLKAAPSPFAPPDPAALAVQRAMVADSYGWFRGLVGARRALDGAALDAVSDGRIFTGRQALANGLIDAVGGERDARDWLAGQGVESDLPVEDFVPRPEDSGLLGLIGDLLGGGAGAAISRFGGGPKLLSILQ